MVRPGLVVLLLTAAVWPVRASSFSYPAFNPVPASFDATNLRTIYLNAAGLAPIDTWHAARVTVQWTGGNSSFGSLQSSAEARIGFSTTGRGGTVASPTLAGAMYTPILPPTAGGQWSHAPALLTWDLGFLTPYPGGSAPLHLDFGQAFYSLHDPANNARWADVRVTLLVPEPGVALSLPALASLMARRRRLG